MAIYNVTNEQYNINFDLKFDTFYNFIESLKESKKYYYDYCKAENINIVEFDNEYINNINKLEGELLKYYILITNDDNVEKFVVINDIIKELHNYMIKIIKDYCIINHMCIIGFNHKTRCNDHTYKYYSLSITESDADDIMNINMNYLTRSQLSKLILLYALNANRHMHYRQGFLEKMNIIRLNFENYSNDSPNICIYQYIILKYNIIEYITINENPQGTSRLNSMATAIVDFYESLNNYLDSLTIKSIYERELDKILITLPNICISHILSKLLNNISDKPNLIDFNEDLNDTYIAVD